MSYSIFDVEENKVLEKCKSLALRYVSMQIKTEGQVAEYLKKKDFEKEIIEEAIEYLRQYNYVNDAEYCKVFFKEGCRKGKGRRRIEQELSNKRVSREVIKGAIDELVSYDNPEYDELLQEVGSEKERALAVGRKMLRQHEELGKVADKNFMARVGRRLVSLGYGNDVLYSTVGTLMNERKVTEDE